MGMKYPKWPKWGPWLKPDIARSAVRLKNMLICQYADLSTKISLHTTTNISSKGHIGTGKSIYPVHISIIKVIHQNETLLLIE